MINITLNMYQQHIQNNIFEVKIRSKYGTHAFWSKSYINPIRDADKKVIVFNSVILKLFDLFLICYQIKTKPLISKFAYSF